MEERKQRWLKGSFTVEMAFLIPMILFLIMGCIRISFYYHDKNIIAGAAYETAVTGSTKVREKAVWEKMKLKYRQLQDERKWQYL